MKYVFIVALLFITVMFGKAQTATVQNAAIPKDAPVEVTVTDFKDKVLEHEIIIFKSKLNSREYQGLTDATGKFSIRLPVGDDYEMFILGFQDAESYNVLKIPATEGKAYYKNPFKVTIQFLPSKTFVLENCNFETGKVTLDTASYTVLDELVAYLTRKEEQRIEIGGHTDNVGSSANNLKLSMERATTVMNYLIAKGIDTARLEAKGYGATMPVEDNKTEDGRATNRRTEITVL